MIRMYANSFDPGHRPWSVDHGTQDTEETLDIVIVCASGHTKEGPRKEGAPTGWIEFSDGKLKILDVPETGKRIAYIL